MAWLLIFLAGLNSTIGNMMLKQSRSAPTESFFYSLSDPWFIGGLFFYGTNVVLFAKSLDYLPVSVAYPALAGSGFFLLVVLSKVFFSEAITAYKLIGICAIFVGILIISLTAE